MTPSAAVAARGVERAIAGRRRQYEEEVDRLLDAMFQVMRERDTASPSVAEILATAELSTSVFYRHFPTKDDLFVTALERAHVRTRLHIEERLAARQDPAARIAEWVRAMFDLLRTEELVTANRPFLLAHPRLLERFPDEISAGFDALVEPLATAITDARTLAGASTDSAMVDARLAMHQVFGLLIDWAALRQTSDPATVESVASYTMRAVLQSDPALPTPTGRPSRPTRGTRGRTAH